MSFKEEFKFGQVVCSDAIEFLRGLKESSIDLVVTDPPYNSGISWDKKNDEWQIEWLEEVKRVMKEGASFYTFFAPMNMWKVGEWIRNNLTLKNIVVWHHPNLYGAGMSYGKDRYKSTWDVVFYAVKGKKVKHSKNVSSVAYRETGKGFDVMICPQPRPLLHKAQKPLDIVERFILCSSNVGDVVLDPFCGVGTVPIVCSYLGRRFIGIDNSELFCRISGIRLRNIARLSVVDRKLWRWLKRRGDPSLSERRDLEDG